jgi:hypothetical protein
MNIFFDLEFTGLHQGTTLISLGMVSEDGRKFYAEATDYDRSQVSPWIEENVIKNLRYSASDPGAHLAADEEGYLFIPLKGTRKYIADALRTWLSGFDSVEFWGDVLPYDWVVFCELFENKEDPAERLPRNVYYIPFDIATLMKVKGIDPDISREAFSGISLNKHNALDDARIVEACYLRLMSL